MSKTDTSGRSPEVLTRDELIQAMKRPKTNKYHVGIPEARTADNIIFDSIRECHRYLALKTLLRSGVIHDLELQPKFPIVVHDQHICFVIADFSYYDLDGRRIVEDTKGVSTALFKLKAKLFHACYPHLRIVLS